MNQDNNKPHGSYKELLFDKRWLEKRAQIIRRDKFQCTICGSDNHLTVHHKQYHFDSKKEQKLAPWEYADHYLITLCESCHRRGHAKFDIPTKTINNK